MVSAFAQQRFVLLVAGFRARKFEQFHLLKLVLAQNSAGIFSSRPRFGAEAGSPRRDADGKFFLRQSFVTIQIVQFHFAGRRQPEIGIFNLEQIGGKLGQLPRAHE